MIDPAQKPVDAAGSTLDLARRALALHARYRGKIEMQAKGPLRDLRELAIWDTPGGAALLFKLFGGVDATPLCIRVREAGDIVRAVEMIEPSFGGVNLEDISQPKCFAVLDEARRRVSLPVWHDDPQGCATAALAALIAAP